jgi:peroxiredoxin
VAGGDTLPREDDVAPAFALASPDGTVVSLESQVQPHRAVVLVFYRGYF